MLFYDLILALPEDMFSLLLKDMFFFLFVGPIEANLKFQDPDLPRGWSNIAFF